MWEKLPSLPIERIGCSVTELNGSLFVFGGFDARGALSNKILKWTAGRKEWREVKIAGERQLPNFNEHLAVIYKDELWIFGTLRSIRIGAREFCTAVFNFAERCWRRVFATDQLPRSVEEFSIHGHLLHEDALFVATEDGIFGYDFEKNRWSSIFREQSVPMFAGQYHITLHVNRRPGCVST